jgi:type I restriction enzyme R subunit
LDKEFFYIFDYCQNLEYFSQNPEGSAGSQNESLSTKLFKARLELVGELDANVDSSLVKFTPRHDFDPESERQVQLQVMHLLHTQVASMNLDNFVVRAKRRSVEKFAKKEAWEKLTAEDRRELAQEIASLPTQTESESEEAKRFDLLVLKLQLALLGNEPSFERLREQVVKIAGLLEEKHTIPMVGKQMTYIQDVQREEWWQDVNVTMLEIIRRRLRDLVQFIERKERKPIYTNFEDEMGEESSIELTEFVGQDTFERFRDKARAFLRKHLDVDAVRKLHTNEPLSTGDLDDLERVLTDNKIGKSEYIEQAKQENESFGIFVRTLVGLDREVAKGLFNEFLSGTTYNANQIEFINLIINQLVDHGIVDIGLLYESPFTDISPTGPDALFTTEQVNRIVQLLEEIRLTALAA